MSYKVAYKAIGITDYARFITNKDNRNDDFTLGAPGFARTLPGMSSGDLFASSYGPRRQVSRHGRAPHRTPWEA